MKRIWLTLALVLGLSSALQAQTRTTITATIQDPGGTVATSGYVEFRLSPASTGIAYRISGSGLIAPTTTRCLINAFGQLPSCAIWGGGTITPANTTYTVVVAPNNVVSQTYTSVLISGTTYNLASIVFSPTIKLTPEQQIVTVPPTTANIIPATTKVFSLGAADRYYASAYIDNLFANNLIGLTILNKHRYCDQYPGADAAAQIQACVTDLFTSGGGIADAQGLLGGSLASGTVTFPAVPIQLLLGTGTYATTSLNHLAAFVTSAGSSIIGHGIGNTIIKINATGVNADGITPAANTLIRDLTLQGNTTASPGSTAVDGCNCTGVEIDHVEVKNWASHGINSGGNDTNGGWNIHDSYIHDNYDDGLLLGGVGGHMVVNNRIVTNGSNGIDLNSPNNFVRGNTVTGNGANYSGTGIDCYGILSTSIGSGSADDNVIDGNRVLNNKCQGIILRGDQVGHTNHNVVINNIVSSNVAAGGAGVGINIDTSIGGTCGTVNYTLIANNVVYGMSAQGILLGGGAGTPCIDNFTTIKDNIVTGNTGVGIFVVWGTSTTVSNNVSLSNTAGNLTINSGATRTLDAGNLTDSTLNQFTIGNGNLAVDTIIPGTAGANQVKVQGPGNTQFTLHSTGGGSYRDYSLLLDSGGNFYIYDATAPAIRMSMTNGGAVDFKNNFTVGSGSFINKILTGVATLDFPNTAAQLSADLTITVTGASDQDTCIVGPPAASYGGNDTWTCFVSAADTVSVRFNNYSAGAQNPPSGQFKVTLIRF